MKRLILGLVLGVSGWLSGAEPSSPVWNALIEGIDQFTLDFYQKISPAPGNLVVSPLSLSSALAIPYMGAKGETAQEMASVLYYPHVEDALLASTYVKLAEHLEAKGTDGYELHMANALWTSEDLPLTGKFKSLINDYYKGSFQEVDFATPKKARREINDWVKEETGGKITELMQEGSVSPQDKLIVVSALFLCADWAFPFDSHKTKLTPFHVSKKEVVKAETMHGQMRLPHYADGTIEAIALPYEGGQSASQLVMLLLLPKADGLKTFEKSLTLDQLKSVLSSMTLKTTDVALPKFRMATRVYAKDILQNMGMEEPFSKGADFSGINGKRNLLLSAAVHQAYLDVDEYGTEASSASAVSVGIKSAPPEKAQVEFVADHPFMALLLDAASGQILFIGRVGNPTSDL